MAQYLTSLAAFTEDLSLFLTTHMAVHSLFYLAPRNLDTFFWPLQTLNTHVLTCMQAKHS